MNDIFSLAKELSDIYEVSYNMIETEVKLIISNNIRDIKIIESYLDRLLDIPTDKGLILFVNLANNLKKLEKIIIYHKKNLLIR